MSRRGAHMLTLVIALAALASVFFGLRSYASFLLLRSAYEVGRPQVSSLRAWMTLDHVAITYRVPLGALAQRLGLPPDTDRNETLKSIADRRGVSRFEFVREAQRAIGAAPPPPDTGEKTQGGLADRVLSAVLAYGYPALAAALMLGAAGLPLPTGLVTLLAGSLAALGQINWLGAAIVAIVASAMGDAIAFTIGRLIGEASLTRHGRWIGYSPARFERVQALFTRWGGLTVLVSRTLASQLSSLISLLAGVSRYPWAAFLTFVAAGRVVWTSAYLGLGYAIGSNIDAASQFLGNLSGLLAALAVLAVASLYRSGLMARAMA
jgi:membrane protein DedA with SNARE-associated domain